MRDADPATNHGRVAIFTAYATLNLLTQQHDASGCCVPVLVGRVLAGYHESWSRHADVGGVVAQTDGLSW